MTRLLAAWSLFGLALLGASAGAQSDPSSWNRFFGRDAYVFGTDPVPLLPEYVHTFRRGRALDLAMGEGRNAVFLAKQGFDVTGVDFSSVAIRKSLELAAKQGVRLTVVEADLRTYAIPRESYDLITNIYYPQRHLFDAVREGLKPGGVFVYEQWHPYGWKTRGPKGLIRPPRPEQAELFQYSDVRLDELAAIFADYQIVMYREAVIDQAVAPGSRRARALTEVSSLIAKKPF